MSILSLSSSDPVLEMQDVTVTYRDQVAVQGVSLAIPEKCVTAFIGPSGCGKSTLLRCFNRLNDLIPHAQIQGHIWFRGHDIYGPQVDPTRLRHHIGMVFQKPTPFPQSIFNNLAYGPRLYGKRNRHYLEQQAQEVLQRTALWDEVKDKLDQSGLSLSGGQQQRLCIARALTIQPQVLLMDEPCSALDPLSTQTIESLLQDLKQDYTIVIVTHNLQQALRISDYTAFFNMERTESDESWSGLVEFGPTATLFSEPQNLATAKYITGQFG